MDSYPADASKLLKQDKDRFDNPIGYSVSQEIKAIYEELLSDMHSDKLLSSLDNIIRIRAVQDFTPSQAIAFIFKLKKAVRDELGHEIRSNKIFKELLDFESRIDELALFALDLYVKCREKIHEIRVGEVKAERDRAFRLLESTNLAYEKLEKG